MGTNPLQPRAAAIDVTVLAVNRFVYRKVIDRGENALTTWIAFFRSINVGGNNILPMRELATLLEKVGCVQIKTYIQSGNAVFKSRESRVQEMATLIETSVEKKFGFRPRLILLSEKELLKAASENPFVDAAKTDPGYLHLWFLGAKPKRPDLATLNGLKTSKERFALKGKIFYLHASEGIGKSKLAARVEKSLGISGTARNWNTVTKMIELVKELNGV